MQVTVGAPGGERAREKHAPSEPTEPKLKTLWKVTVTSLKSKAALHLTGDNCDSPQSLRALQGPMKEWEEGAT